MDYSKYFQRSFSKFMDNLGSKRTIDKPSVKDSDIESFFIHVTELKARVLELEKAISVHCFEEKGQVHPHNKRLLNSCRINEREAYELWGEVLRFRDEENKRNDYFIR